MVCSLVTSSPSLPRVRSRVKIDVVGGVGVTVVVGTIAVFNSLLISVRVIGPK